ncbi:MAG: DUF3343 domain-containing protein [Candidatus Adiutrix sp.]|jgi:hypothetical protein|nr:DUF3343 domain-containing protein [Candidatus Adiutrix sp.]
MTFLEPVMSSPEQHWRAMNGGGKIILVFASNTLVLNAEDLLDDLDMLFELIPVPKEVNPNCGLAISFQEEDSPAIMAALKLAGLKPETVYRRIGSTFQPWADKAVLEEKNIKVM